VTPLAPRGLCLPHVRPAATALTFAAAGATAAARRSSVGEPPPPRGTAAVAVGGGGAGAHLGSDIRPGPATHRGCYVTAVTPRPVHRRRGSEGSRACAPSQPAQGLCQTPNGAAEVAPTRSQDARAASAARCVLGSRTPNSRIARPVHALGAAAGRGPGGRVSQVVNIQDLVTACLWAH
jgi:hypothetical protein